MVSKRYNESELYDFAAQILLKEKKWDDFDFLTEDDKKKVHSIVSRGTKALSQKRVKQKRHEVSISQARHKVVSTNASDKVSSKKTEPKKRRIGVTKLAQRAGFKVFPLVELEKETSLVRRKLMEALSRCLDAKDFARLFTIFLEGEAEYLLAVVSENLAKEIRFHMENKEERSQWTNYDSNAVFAKYSILSVKYLAAEEDVSVALKKEVVAYCETLFKQLKVYCSSLPEKLGIVAILANFTQAKWRKLAGLTPRQDMAVLFFVVDKGNMNQMLSYLPPLQKKDVEEAIQFYERTMQGDIEFFVKALDILKNWGAVIMKLEEES